MAKTSSRLVEAVLLVIDEIGRHWRTVIPGKVATEKRASDRERDVGFEPGPGRRQGGEEVADGVVDDAPVMQLCGGGFAFLLPLAAGDEALGLAADRNVGAWRQNRDPGRADLFDRHHDLSDTVVLPFAITAPNNAPADWGTDFVALGPAGTYLQVTAEGEITITKQGGSGTATIVMDAAGKVTITPAAGQTIELGGVLDMALGQALIDAIDTMLAGGVVVAQDGGASLKTTMTTAWNAVKNTIKSTTVKGGA